MRTRRWIALCAVGAVMLSGCSDEPAPYDALWAETTSQISTPTTTTSGVDGQQVVHQRPHLMDAQGRYVHIFGINVSGSHKAPPTEAFPSRYPLADDPDCRCAQSCLATDVDCLTECPMPPAADCVLSQEVSYVGSPFPLADADTWFGTLQRLGFNAVRLITNWESIQPYAPGTCQDREPGRYTEECYDLDYLDYYEAIVAKAEEYGIYVLVDMHQDVFSRHLMGYFRENPTYIDDNTQEEVQTEPGSLDALVLSLFPPYTDWARGHGAPKWVVQTCLPEKNMDSPYWGMSRIIGALLDDNGNPNLGFLLDQLGGLFERFFPDGDLPPWLGYLANQLPPERFGVQDTSDFLPLSPWVIPGVLSLDADRCYAALFAGDTVFPDLLVDDGVTRRRTDDDPDTLPGLGTYLQTAYADAFRQVAERTRAHDNILGYDLINEPLGIFLMLTLASGYVQGGGPDSMLGLLVSLLPAEDGELPAGLAAEPPVDPGEKAAWLSQCESLACDLYVVIRDLALLPPDTEPETLEAWGLADVDILAALGLNLGFEANQLQPFYEYVGQAIQEVDPNAVIWIEPATSLRMITGASQFFDMPLTRPQGLNQVVFAPHWYPDIYPLPGIGSSPREFNADEWLYRDFTGSLEAFMEEAPTWLGNVPVVFGEFGTYFNFNGIQASIDNDYAISAHILDSYYRAFEELGIGHMVWCFAADNDSHYGEHWNQENFSIIGHDGEPRAWPAYVRTHARATSGKLVAQRFHGQFEFWDPSFGEPPPERTYTLTMETHEADAPTEIFVPATIETSDWSSVQYPGGFYVWLSDGAAFYDAARQVLYWYPTREAPGTLHTLRIEPSLPDREALGWSYYFEGEHALVGVGDTTTTGHVIAP
ncbi:MAG: cellulase family glycosylhydrolase [Myxococcota bacterium]|nr:cellulase family glycosylhydrolase [Myxococcota bacterium]